ncbi:MAG TPA: BTAD domain-containing putative transcriptional regulator [Jiangellaceae bacterium]
MRQPRTLQLRLFNYWYLDSDRQPIHVPSRSQRLVALLALRGRQNRARLAGTLWPDTDEHRAQASLRAAISALQRRAPGLVEKDHGDVLLSEHVAIDIVRFRRHADHVLAGRLGVPPSTVDHSDVSGGELLPGWYDDWVVVEQERTHQLRLHVLEALARELAERGAHAHALQAALKAVEIDPLRETARRAVINVHLAQGNTADALREYQRFRDLLQQELGVGPSRHLTELIAQITRPSRT